MARWDRLEVFGADLLQLKAPKSSQTAYVVVELKGLGCDYWQRHLGAFIRAVNGSGFRWHGKRVDYRWDGSEVSPQLVDAAARAGHFVSRSLSVADRDWRDNSEGQTAYLGSHVKPKLLRVYNRRGFNRVELELHDEWSDQLLREFIAGEEARWPELALGYLLGTVDFRRVTNPVTGWRAPRLPWWSEFVGQAEKVSRISRANPELPAAAPLAIGAADEWVKRNRRRLMQIIEGLGAEWLLKRVEFYRRGELPSELDQNVINQLRKMANSGLCGTSEVKSPGRHSWVEELPT